MGCPMILRGIKLNASVLKYMACLFMLVDHVGVLLFPEITAFRIVGRLAFPLFAFFISEGFAHTHSAGRYLLRLLIFAFCFQGIYSHCMPGGYLNIFFTLAFGLLSLMSFEALHQREGKLFSVLAWLTVPAFFLLSDLFNVEYGWYGVALIFAAHYFRGNLRSVGVAWTIFTVLFVAGGVASWIQYFSLLALVPLALYSGEKGNAKRWFFYCFYCLHIPFLWGLSLLI